MYKYFPNFHLFAGVLVVKANDGNISRVMEAWLVRHQELLAEQYIYSQDY